MLPGRRCLQAALNAWDSLSAHPCGFLFLRLPFFLRLSFQSQSLPLTIHRHISIGLLSQTTLPTLNIPVQRQQSHSCKRVHDFRLARSKRSGCFCKPTLLLKGDMCRKVRCPQPTEAAWLAQDQRQLGGCQERGNWVPVLLREIDQSLIDWLQQKKKEYIKTNRRITYDPAIPLLGVTQEKKKYYIHTKTCTAMFTAALFPKQETTQMPINR